MPARRRLHPVLVLFCAFLYVSVHLFGERVHTVLHDLTDSRCADCHPDGSDAPEPVVKAGLVVKLKATCEFSRILRAVLSSPRLSSSSLFVAASEFSPAEATPPPKKIEISPVLDPSTSPRGPPTPRQA